MADSVAIFLLYLFDDDCLLIDRCCGGKWTKMEDRVRQKSLGEDKKKMEARGRLRSSVAWLIKKEQFFTWYVDGFFD